MNIFESYHTLFNQEKYDEAIEMLEFELENNPYLIVPHKFFIAEGLLKLYVKKNHLKKAKQMLNDFLENKDFEEKNMLRLEDVYNDLVFDKLHAEKEK